jgi:hypothetical protein
MERSSYAVTADRERELAAEWRYALDRKRSADETEGSQVKAERSEPEGFSLYLGSSLG